MNIREKIKSKAIKLVIFILGISTFLFVYRVQIGDYLFRGYKNFRRSWVGMMDIEMYAGCQPKTMIDEKSDEVFSKMWTEDSKKYNFDAIDVDRYMMQRCPPCTRKEIEAILENYFKDKNFPDMDEEKTKLEGIQRTSEISEYQNKFLNREFTALKNEPR